RLLADLPPALWKKKWVVHCQHAGRGEKVLQYLARYVFRIAITNGRLESVDEDSVRFQYRDNKTHQIRHVSLSGVDFIGRFLQHVLPRGCVKVRNYGLFSPSSRKPYDCARYLLASRLSSDSPALAASSGAPSAVVRPHCCPHCHTGKLLLIETLPAALVKNVVFNRFIQRPRIGLETS